MSVEYQNRIMNRWIAIATFLVSGIVYLITVSPDVAFWDCGEFIACSYTLSVMHPPGAPLYTIIGRLFTFLPISNVAWRVNLISVISAAATVLLLYLIIVRLINLFKGEPKSTSDRLITFGSGFIGALTFAFTTTHWFNATEAEVYALSILFTALTIWLVLFWGDRSEDAKAERYLLLIVYLMGLAIGIHLLNILTFGFIFLIVIFRDNPSARRVVWAVLLQVSVPVFLYILFFNYDPAEMTYNQFIEHQSTAGNFLLIVGLLVGIGSLYYLYKNDMRAFKLWWWIPGLILIGYSGYLIIYIRSGLNPPIDENNPEMWKNMSDYLARKQYGEHSLLLTIFSRKAPFWAYQIKKMYIRYFAWQFVGKGTTIGPHGYIAEIWSMRGLYMIPFTVGLLGMLHHFRRDWKHASAVAVLFFMTGLAIVFYLNQKNPEPRERDYVYEGSFFAFAIWIGIGIYALLEQAQLFFSERKNLIKPATLSGIVILAVILPGNMFRFNFESHDRTGNFLAYDYSYNILQSCEPNAIIFTNGDNDTFPLWYLQFVENIRTDVRIVNLSLLNTPWYIRQLKNQEPKVPISISDEKIGQLGIMAWPEPRKFEIPIPKSAYEETKEFLKETGEWREDFKETGKMTITVEPTVGNPKQAIRVQDIMILNILSANRWKKPIYFAVTVSDQNKIGLQKYLRMDGLAFKIVPYPDLNVSTARLNEGLFDKFKFRNLNDPDLYLDYKSRGLLINYRSAFLRLADSYRRKDNKEMLLKTLNTMEKRIPLELYPVSDTRIVISIGRMYEYAGRPKKYEQILRDVLDQNPQERRAYYWLLDYYRRHAKYQQAVNLLDQWLELYPDDKDARKMRSQFQQQMAAPDTGQKDTLNIK